MKIALHFACSLHHYIYDFKITTGRSSGRGGWEEERFSFFFKRGVGGRKVFFFFYIHILIH